MSGNGHRVTSKKRFAKPPATVYRRKSSNSRSSSNALSSNTTRKIKAGHVKMGVVQRKHGGGVYDVQVGSSVERLSVRGAIKKKPIDVGSSVLVQDGQIHSVLSRKQAAQLKGSSNSGFSY